MAETIVWDDLKIMCKEIKSNLRKMELTNIDIKGYLDECGRGDGEYAYWSGTRALKWFELSYKNVANNYVRMAKMANAMLKICEAVQDIYAADGIKHNNKHIDGLDSYKSVFKTMANDYYTKAKAIAKGSF